MSPQPLSEKPLNAFNNSKLSTSGPTGEVDKIRSLELRLMGTMRTIKNLEHENEVKGDRIKGLEIANEKKAKQIESMQAPQAMASST